MTHSHTCHFLQLTITLRIIANSSAKLTGSTDLDSDSFFSFISYTISLPDPHPSTSFTPHGFLTAFEHTNFFFFFFSVFGTLYQPFPLLESPLSRYSTGLFISVIQDSAQISSLLSPCPKVSHTIGADTPTREKQISKRIISDVIALFFAHLSSPTGTLVSGPGYAFRV